MSVGAGRTARGREQLPVPATIAIARVASFGRPSTGRDVSRLTKSLLHPARYGIVATAIRTSQLVSSAGTTGASAKNATEPSPDCVTPNVPQSNPTACSICFRRQCDHRKQEARPPAHIRGYDGTWQKMRAMVLAEEPLCRMCREKGRTTPAVHLHHDKPLAQYPELRLVRSNLIPLCRAHHDAVEAQRRNQR